ncbi:hypothetical protein HYE68_008655 [Fusarium pseudograminearum]|nr:hypothetical protein HYE68_008655 [Fusarium pseudograminearum]
MEFCIITPIKPRSIKIESCLPPSITPSHGRLPLSYLPRESKLLRILAVDKDTSYSSVPKGGQYEDFSCITNTINTNACEVTALWKAVVEYYRPGVNIPDESPDDAKKTTNFPNPVDILKLHSNLSTKEWALNIASNLNRPMLIPVTYRDNPSMTNSAKTSCIDPIRFMLLHGLDASPQDSSMCLLRHEEGIMVLVISDVSTLMRWKLSLAHVRRLRGPLIPGTLGDIHGLVVAYLSQLIYATICWQSWRRNPGQMVFMYVVDSLAGMARFMEEYEESHGQSGYHACIGHVGDDQSWDAVADVQNQGDDVIELNVAKAMRRVFHLAIIAIWYLDAA